MVSLFGEGVVLLVQLERNKTPYTKGRFIIGIYLISDGI